MTEKSGTNVSQREVQRQWSDGVALAVDIETVPLASALALPYPESERTPPANYKDPEKIAEWRKRDREDWETARIKQYSLSPMYGRVCAIGMAHRDDNDALVESWLTAPQEGDEAAMLTTFWKRSVTFDRLVSYNGLAFDIPFLMVRSAILDVANPWGGQLVKRYATTHHFDVRAVLTQYSTQAKGTLGDWCKAFGLGEKSGTGADVYPMAKAGLYTEIGQYSAHDAALTMQMYERVWPIFE